MWYLNFNFTNFFFKFFKLCSAQCPANSNFEFKLLQVDPIINYEMNDISIHSEASSENNSDGSFDSTGFIDKNISQRQYICLICDQNCRSLQKLKNHTLKLHDYGGKLEENRHFQIILPNMNLAEMEIPEEFPRLEINPNDPFTWPNDLFNK